MEKLEKSHAQNYGSEGEKRQKCTSIVQWSNQPAILFGFYLNPIIVLNTNKDFFLKAKNIKSRNEVFKALYHLKGLPQPTEVMALKYT